MDELGRVDAKIGKLTGGKYPQTTHVVVVIAVVVEFVFVAFVVLLLVFVVSVVLSHRCLYLFPNFLSH